MKMLELKGAAVAAEIKNKAGEKLSRLEGENIKLAIVRVGEREDDLAYERGAKKTMSKLGIETQTYAFSQDISMEEFVQEYSSINNDPAIDGILVLRPLPAQLDERKIAEMTDPLKDVDGINPINMAKVFEADTTGFAPCTAQAAVEILKFYDIKLNGAKVVIAGRSTVVGKPLAMLLLKENATVTMCHSHTRELASLCREADIFIAAVGKARNFNRRFVSTKTVVVDVGINTDADGSLCGDVDYDDIATYASAATPVPGGVGAVTTAVLAEHVVRAALARRRG